MQEHLIELSVGDTLRIGDHTVTIVGIDGDELCLELNHDGETETSIESAFDEELLLSF